jgi:hypothetical protein
VCGDNHGGFVTTIGDTVIVNCGSTMRRTVAQLDYQPQVHILYDDKTVKSVNLDTSNDVVSDRHKQKRVETDNRISAFVDTLVTDVELSLSFPANVHRFMESNNVEDSVREVILEDMV